MSTFHEKLARLIILVTLLLLGVSLHRMLISPKMAGIKSMRHSLANINAEINSFLKETSSKNSTVEPEVALEKEMEKLLLKIPSQNEVPDIINQLLSEGGQRLGIDYSLIDPQPMVSAGKYNRAPIRVAFTIPFKKFTEYLTAIEEMPEIIRVDNLDMRRVQGDNERLMVNLLLSAFVMPEKQKEARLTASQEAATSELLSNNPFSPKSALADKESGSAKKAPLSRASQASESARTPSFNLQGIMSGDFESALINDRIVYLGGFINGWELIKLNEQSVVLRKGTQVITLRSKD